MIPNKPIDINELPLNEDQQSGLRILTSGINVYLFGEAGTGKSFLIKRFRRWVEERGKNIAITSTTGISALLIGGRTIHSWAGIGIGEGSNHEMLTKVRKNSKAVKNWRGVNILVLDEVSMLSPGMLEALEFIARNIRHDDRVFGGIQVVLSGDFCQLPPVKTDMYCFQSPMWDNIIQHYIHLKINMRQNNKRFQELLSRCRMGELTEEDKDILRSRINADIGVLDSENPERSIKPTRLYSHRKTIEDINADELKNILTDNNNIRRYTSRETVLSKNKNKITLEEAKNYIEHFNKISQARPCVDLCIGAQVMLIHNLEPESGLVNGSRGVVVDFQEQRPVVKFLNGLVVLIQSMEWEHNVSDDIKIIRKQIPLILAYSITIHKSQSATIDCLEIDIGDDIFSHGQAYTALSRATSLDGLSISDINFDKITVDPVVKQFYLNERSSCF